jgi:CDP-diacylglycerol--glycerol-3-phosphate 3-phosphatidyltransferase
LNLANRVTLLRIAFIPLVIVLLFFGLNGLAVIFFILLSLSDYLDGYIARRFNQISDAGKILDPLADKILILSVLVMLAWQGKADPFPVILFLARDEMVSGIRISAAKSQKILHASPIAKAKTVTQMFAVPMLILNIPYAGWVLWLAVVFSLLSGGIYLWQSKILKLLRSS